jgi:glycosyltransferase involved in cell wall biosynthesis
MQPDPVDVVLMTKATLSQRYLEKLRQVYGSKVRVASVTEWQKLGVAAMLRAVRAVECDLLAIPLEEPQSRGLLPTLQLLACFTRARRFEVADGELHRVPFSKSSMFRIAPQFVQACVAGAWAALACYWQLRRLRARGKPAAPTNSPRNVLYINANLWFGVKAGGSVGHIAGVINAFRRRGARVVFTACGAQAHPQSGAENLDLKAPEVLSIPVEFNNYRFQRMNQRQFARDPRLKSFDAVYQRVSLGNYAGIHAARRLGVPLIAEYNGSEAWVSRNWGKALNFHDLAVAAEQAMLDHAELVVTISDVLREELLSRGVPAHRIVMYPNCIDPEMFDPSRFQAAELQALRSRHGVNSDDLVVMFVGTFGQWHGAEVLAHAIAILVRQDPDWLERQRVRFMLVGDGEKMRDVRARLQGIDPRFYVLTGLVPQGDAPRYLATADILVSPHVPNPDGSRFFGSPTKLFEYMAMNKAILASNLEQIGEVLSPSLPVGQLPERAPRTDDQALAVLTTPGNVDDVVTGLRYLIERPDWRTKLGGNARAAALARYTWDHHVDAILDGLARAQRIGAAAGA